MNIKGQNTKVFYIYVLFFIVGIIFRLGNLSQELWLDEAGQFWISQGQNHYQENLFRGGISQVWINNREFNLDPPLFGSILYYWTKVSTSTIWLRLLPIFFGFIAIYFTYKTMIIFNRNNKVLQAGLVAFMVTNYTMTYYSIELRAFSLAQALLMVTIYYFTKYISEQNSSDLIRLMITSLISLYCLYSLWMFQVPIYFLLLIKYPKRIVKYVALLIPVIVVIFSIYWFQMRSQINGFSLEYVKHFKLSSYPLFEGFQKLYEFHKEHWRYLFFYTPMFGSLERHLATIFRAMFDSVSLLTLMMGIAVYFQRKSQFPKILFCLYFMHIALISYMSFMGKFPIGPNRWNLFYAPLEILLFGLVCDIVWSRFSLLVNMFMITLILLNIAQSSFFPRIGPFLEQAMEKTDVSRDNYFLYSWDVVPSFKYILLSKGGNNSQFYYKHDFDDILGHRQQNFTNFVHNKKVSIVISKVPQHFIFSNIDKDTYEQNLRDLRDNFGSNCLISSRDSLMYRLVSLDCGRQRAI